MQLFSYYLHPFNFIACLSCFFLLYNMFYSFSQYISCFILFLDVLWFSQHVYLFSNMFYCFDVVGLAFLGQDMPKFLACAQIYMFVCLKLCLDVVPSTLQLHISCFCLFLVFGFCIGCRSRSCGLGIHPYTQFSIKGLDQFLCACLSFVCPCPCFLPQIHACLLRSRLFAMFLFVFRMWVSCLLAFRATYLFGCICPLWWLAWMQPCVRTHLRDVWLACRLPFSSFVQPCVLGFLMLAPLCAL